MRTHRRLNAVIAAAFVLGALGAQAATPTAKPTGLATTPTSQTVAKNAQRDCKDAQGNKTDCQKPAATPH